MQSSTTTPLPAFEARTRIKSLDIARGIAMVFVVVIHVIEQLAGPEVEGSLFGGLLHMGTSMCAAAMFMFLMGTGISLSKSTSLTKGVMRGVGLLAVAYILNILRGTIPTFAGLEFQFFTLEQLKPYSPLYVTVELDILHFAGFAIILIAVLRHVAPKWPVWLITAGAVLGLCPLVFGHKTGSDIGNYFVNYLWRTEEYGHFPVFPWLAYPLVGMVFGHFFKKSSNYTVFFAKSCFIGVVLCLCGGYVAYNYTNFSIASWMAGEYNEGEIHPWIVISEMGVILVSISMYHFILSRVPWNKAFEWLSFWSKNVTVMYCIEWIVIGWMVIFMPHRLGFFLTITSMLFVFVATHYLGVAWLRMTKKNIKK